MYVDEDAPNEEDWNLGYVEFDERYIFVALREEIGVWRFDDGEFVTTLPTILYHDDPEPYQWDTLHVDLIGKDLVAISTGTSALLWIKNYWDYFEMEEFGGEDQIGKEDVLILELMDIDLQQLSVENGRAVLVAVHEASTTFSLFLLNLSHDSLPVPYLLHPCLPAPVTPSRVEQTSTSIYVPIQTALLPTPYDRKAHGPLFPSSWEWSTSDGNVISSRRGGGDNDVRVSKWRHDMYHKSANLLAGGWVRWDGFAEFCFE